ncbi:MULTISPECIES: DUF397 domain-containing protein [Actinoalloteichus]|uniref:DUF397 family protein n=1 Tax=Actinoalloteichus fjordicus TaxID=1612552 RepID=A0AAC9PQF2_9PSEU|nr:MULTISPECIES: DUF397 domain-containing protein [Actinoalloteichus]APU12862.1 putative DUF397 family protein [Actinoalloteichus fjordicus]APU18834.1 putative DUF397 family protein [Actinoalloteichus sp. GBA129-24]
MNKGPAPARWKTSTRTAGNGNCVEVGISPGLVGIRDTKNPDGGTLVVDQHAFAAFVASVKCAN